MIRRALFRYTARRPCRLIDIEGRPYLERYYLGSLFGVTAYLHRFVGYDSDREVHDHPWTLFVHGRRFKTWGFLRRGRSGARYFQPFDVNATRRWWERAPLGRDADRVEQG